MSDAPTLAELLESAIDGSISGVRVALPGRIEAYDGTTRRATVQVLIMDAYAAEDGTRTAVSLKPLADVPVVGIGSRGVRIKFPVRKGDLCMLLFSSSSIAACKATGRLADPGDDRHHHLADAIAIPWVLGFGGSPKDGDGDGDEDAMIEFTASGLIRAGGDQPLVTKAEFEAHVHTVATTGTATAQTGTAAAPLPITGTPKLRG